MRNRRSGMRRPEDTYYYEMAEREAEEEKRRLEANLRKQRTELIESNLRHLEEEGTKHRREL